MPLHPDPQWHALPALLEADLDRGMCLAWRIECEPPAGVIAQRVLLHEFEHVAIEAGRWLDRADQRGVCIRDLAGRICQFREALANARRQGRRR